MIFELTSLKKEGGDKITVVIPETTPVMIDRVVNAAGEVLGTRLVISGLGTVICQEAYETVRSLVQKYMGVRGVYVN